jgi:hypothetical protein
VGQRVSGRAKGVSEGAPYVAGDCRRGRGRGGMDVHSIGEAKGSE